MITMEPKIQSTTSTRALRSKIGPIKAYLFKTSYVISPITPSDLKHSMKGAYKSFLSKTDQAYGHSTSTINPKLYPISTFKQMSLVVVPSFMIESPFEVVAIALIAFLLILLSMREHRHKKDILDTERNMAEEVIRLREKAEESNRLTSAFLANMSHEIRTPLNAIVGFSNILASTDNLEDKKEFADIIENNNSLLLQLINDILDLSKIEAGTLEFTYDYVDINAVLRDLEQSAHLKNKNPDVQISFKDYLEPCVIYTDRNRLSQLMINLLNNAMKFTQAGLISFGYKLRDDNTLWFYVEDTGCGIPENKRKDIFGRFVKLNTFAQGTGLGLSICEMIVTQMKGTIGVDSMEGKGSKFWFTLPFQPKKELFPSEEQKPVTLEKIARSEVTILIAEDNSSNYRLFESILKPEYKLIHAWNGKEAVELFYQHKPQLILMDIKMPVMDGYEATAEIRKVSASVPIIAVTAYAFAQDEQRIINSGFDAYTAKPINGKILKDKISTLLTHRIILM